jgi:hypothetical protein
MANAPQPGTTALGVGISVAGALDGPILIAVQALKVSARRP